MLIEGSSCQSRLVKNEIPYLLWTIKRDVVDYHSLTCDQMLNHYGKTASFTTKVDRRLRPGVHPRGWAPENHRDCSGSSSSPKHLLPPVPYAHPHPCSSLSGYSHAMEHGSSQSHGSQWSSLCVRLPTEVPNALLSLWRLGCV